MGKNTKALNASVDEYLVSQHETIRNQSYDIYSLSELTPGTMYYPKLLDYLLATSNTNLCLKIKFLEKKGELCEKLDSKIPTKGFVESYYRTIQYLNEAYQLTVGGKMDPIVLMNDP